MSRLPATSAENLANELHRQLELVEFERDEAIRERDEAQAVIEQCRKVRQSLNRTLTMHYRRWNEDDRTEDAAACAAFTVAIGMLDKVDGL